MAKCLPGVYGEGVDHTNGGFAFIVVAGVRYSAPIVARLLLAVSELKEHNNGRTKEKPQV